MKNAGVGLLWLTRKPFGMRRLATAFLADIVQGDLEGNQEDFGIYDRPSASFTNAYSAWFTGVGTPSSAPRRAT